MNLTEAKDRDAALIERLVRVWESSVRATHLFLSDDEIDAIKQYVPQALGSVPVLIVAENEDGDPVGFMGIADDVLEMLFISDECRGKGTGRRLLEYGMEGYSVRRLAVNEQTPSQKASTSTWDSKSTKEPSWTTREAPTLFCA